MSFFIHKNGFWINSGFEGHCYDEKLCAGIALLLQKTKLKTVLDLGCGPGFYVRALRNRGLDVNGFDGNPFTEQITKQVLGDNYVCQQLDLSKKNVLNKPVDCILSLEVGEHIPSSCEDIFLDNICQNAKQCIILSWAIEGQRGDGHINCRNNDYIIAKIKERGFLECEDAKKNLRDVATFFWFKRTIMIFWRAPM